MAGMYNPGEWIAAWINGLNSFSWILCMSIFGCIFAEMSLRLGTIDTIVGAFAAKFGHRPRTLIVSAQFGRKVDPVKAMVYAVPMCVMFAAVGFTLLFIA